MHLLARITDRFESALVNTVWRLDEVALTVATHSVVREFGILPMFFQYNLVQFR